MTKIIKEYRGATLLSLNILLFLILVFGQNALSLFQTGYAGADPLVDASEKDIALLEIHDSEFGGYTVRLMRGKKLSAAKEKNTKKASLGNKSPTKLSYEWSFELYADSETADAKPVVRYKADAERLLDLLKGLQNTRDYYGIPRNPKKEAALGMGTDEKGRFEGLEIRIYAKKDARPTVLYVSKRSARGSQSYVRLKASDTIYLAEENLPSLAGMAERLYFRDRSILPSTIKVENITMLDALWQKPRLRVQLSKQKEAWLLVLPEQAEADKNEVESLLRDILSWKASAYHAELPKEADRSGGLDLSLYYNPTGTITEQVRKNLTLYPKKDSSSIYYVKPDGESDWREISSIYLEDLKKPVERYRKRPELR